MGNLSKGKKHIFFSEGVEFLDFLDFDVCTVYFLYVYLGLELSIYTKYILKKMAGMRLYN